MATVSQFDLDPYRLEQADFMLDYPPFDPDEETGPAESWPWWTDAHTWELDDDQADEYPALEPDMECEPEAFEPTAADRAWLAPLSIADDLDDRAQTMEALLMSDRREAIESMHAADLAAV